jgi:hypothetical protein
MELKKKIKMGVSSVVVRLFNVTLGEGRRWNCMNVCICLPVVFIRLDWFALGLITENETQIENKLGRQGSCQVSETESVSYEVGQNHELLAVISVFCL